MKSCRCDQSEKKNLATVDDNANSVPSLQTEHISYTPIDQCGIESLVFIAGLHVVATCQACCCDELTTVESSIMTSCCNRCNNAPLQPMCVAGGRPMEPGW